jgi:hypothetical protein
MRPLWKAPSNSPAPVITAMALDPESVTFPIEAPPDAQRVPECSALRSASDNRVIVKMRADLRAPGCSSPE